MMITFIVGVINVVSLGTGSKCIGEHKMSPEGNYYNRSAAINLIIYNGRLAS